MTETTTIPAELDHVIYAGPDLPEAIDAVERLTGVRAAPGGTHPTGTANALIAFTVGGRRVPHYLGAALLSPGLARSPPWSCSACGSSTRIRRCWLAGSACSARRWSCAEPPASQVPHVI